MQISHKNALTLETAVKRYCSIQGSRYKGRTDPKDIEKTYPHIVEMIVPVSGFGRKLDDMYEWHRR